MTTYPLRRGAAMLTGVALIAAETFINLSHIRLPGTALSLESLAEQPLLIAVGVAGLAQAIAVPVMIAAWRQRRPALAIITLVGLLAAVAFTFSTTYERTAGARETRAQQADARNGAQRTASSRVASAKARVAAECVTRGTECRKREAELADAEATAAAQPREITVKALGSLDIVPELALPVMLMLLGFAFVGFVDPPVAATKATRLSDSAQTSFPLDLDPPPAARFQPDADEVSEREARVTDFYRAHVRRHGRAPRHADVMRATGLPRATASRYLARARASA